MDSRYLPPLVIVDGRLRRRSSLERERRAREDSLRRLRRIAEGEAIAAAKNELFENRYVCANCGRATVTGLCGCPRANPLGPWKLTNEEAA